MGRGWSSGRRGHIGYEEAKRGGVTEAPEREGEGREESCRKGKVWKMAVFKRSESGKLPIKRSW